MQFLPLDLSPSWVEGAWVAREVLDCGNWGGFTVGNELRGKCVRFAHPSPSGFSPGHWPQPDPDAGCHPVVSRRVGEVAATPRRNLKESSCCESA